MTDSQRIPAGEAPEPFKPGLLDWKPGHVIHGVYEVIEQLGEGGMGKVFHILHRGWRMPLAVKIPMPNVLGAEEAFKRFERECKHWIELDSHPYMVICYFVRRLDRFPLVFMEYLEHGSLAEHIAKGDLYRTDAHTLFRRILRIAIESALALEYAHSKGLVHGDVKPGNYLIADGGQLKLTDLGLARALLESSNVQADETPLLTPAYCSPEQAAGKELSPQSDMWSWAVMMLELLAGEVTWMSGLAAPHVLKDLEHALTEEPRRGIAGRSQGSLSRVTEIEVPEVFLCLLRDVLRVEPERRPSSMTEIVQRLQEIHVSVAGRPLRDLGRETSNRERKRRQLADLNNRAVSLIELGDYEQAEERLRRAYVKDNPGFDASQTLQVQSVAYNLCRLQLQQGKRAAPESFEEIIPIGNDPRRHALLTSMLCLEAGHLSEAITHLDPGEHTERQSRAEAFNIRGIALLLNGETRPALLSFSEALLHAPGRIDINRNRALAHYYDGQISKACRTYSQVASRSLLELGDAIRFAVVLSASGRRDEAVPLLWQALEYRARPSWITLTTAELAAGAQTFLPWITPVGPASTPSPTLAQEAAGRELANLRARVDAATLPRRFGLKLGAVIRGRRRILLKKGAPERIAGSIASSYCVLTRRLRWGDISSPSLRLALIAAAGIPSALAALIISYFLCRHHFQLVPLIAGVATALALLLTLRGGPSNRLAVELIRLAPFAAVPLALDRTLLSQSLSPDAAFAIRSTIPVTFAVFLVWQSILQHLTAFSRALNCSPWHAFASLPKVLWQSLASTGTPLARNEEHHLARESTRPMDNTLIRRLGPSVVACLYRIGPAFTIGFQRLRESLFSWQIFLIPEILALAYLVQTAGPEHPWTPFLPLLAIPLLLSFFSPWLTLTLNIPASVLIMVSAAYTWLEMNPDLLNQSGLVADPLSLQTQKTALGIAASCISITLSWSAFARCPEFIPHWKNCHPEPWDIRQIVDPLNIREHAAPWSLVEPERRI